MNSFDFHFPPLIHFNNSFFPLSNIQNSSQSALEQTSKPSNGKSQLKFFQFNEADKRLNDFYEAGICDLYGKITEKFKASSIKSSFNNLSVFQTMILQIKEILTEKHVVLSTKLKINNKKTIQISISTSLEELFKHVIKLSNENKLKEADQQTIFKILEIYLIGSSVPSIIGKQAFEALAIHHFGHLFSENMIKHWFNNMDHLQEFFSHLGNDLDTRTIISSHQIEAVGSFSDLFLNYLNQQIPSEALTHIQKFYPRSKSRNEILNFYLLSSTAIKNRIKVNDSHSTFSLLALNTDTIPIDLNCVGSTFNEETKNHEPTLECSNLTSLNSLAIPLMQFLTTEYPIESFSSYLSDCGVQTLLDILFNCATPTTHNQFGWRYFLRKYHRMLDPNDEKKMIESVLEYKKSNDYTIISKHKFLPNPSDIKTLGGFIYLLLANDFIKVETESPSDPFILSEYLFRACLSLITYSEMNNDDCKKLWECVDQFYWKPLKRTSKSDSIYRLMKTAILEDNIPFSILSSYINVLAYLYHANRATRHCHTPIIRLKSPISVFAPIQVQTDSEALFHYFSTHPYTTSLQKIYECFSRSSELTLVNPPLLQFFPQFAIHPPTLEIIFQKWIKIDQPSLKLIGLQLYLSCFPFLCDSSILFNEIFLNPQFFISIETPQQKLAIFKSLNWIAGVEFHQATPLIQQLSHYQFNQYDRKTWIQVLIETNTPYTIDLAYSFFIKHHHEIQELQIHCSLFSSLLTQDHLHRAFIVYQLLQTSYQLSSKQELIQFFIPLLKQYQCLSSPLKFQYHLSIFKAFHGFFDQNSPIEFKDLEQRLDFASLLFSFLQDHFSIKTYENLCDHYLIEASRLNYLTKHHRQTLWMKRIVQLIDEPHVQYGAVLFLFAVENKWILPEKFIQKYSTNVCLQLIEGLFKENQCQFIKTLLMLLKNKSENDQVTLSFYELISIYLNQYTLKVNSEDDQEILFLLIKMTSKNEKDKITLLLLEFLDSSSQLLSKENENFLWLIFEQILKNKCPDRTKFFVVLSKLLS
ncbi:MAG: hypothetical protein Q8K60_06020 [Parachlamydiaceae bacterium]|nr:hypothetical protein [Parachlamydiaceae bacterium]